MRPSDTEADADAAEPVPLASLSAFLDGHGLGRGPIALTRIGEGHSNLTYLVVRGDRRMVLRRPPRPPYPPNAHDVGREGRLQQALGRYGAQVPRVLVVCDDASTIGAPFYVSEYVDGIVIDDATPDAFAEPRARAAIARAFAGSLARLHAIEPGRAQLCTFGRPVGYLDRQLTRFTRVLADQPRASSCLARVGRWLRQHVPTSGPARVVHGDYRLGNVMLAARPPAEVVAVLDWEMGTVGDPLVDVGWMSALWAQPGDPAGLLKLSPATAEPGYPSRDALIDHYCSAAGTERADLTWYTVLALWRFSIIMEANYTRAVSGLSDDAFALRFGPDIAEIADFAAELAGA